VVVEQGGHRLRGDGPITEVANAYLAHLQSRGFAPGTVRGYAFDLLNFSRFLADRGIAAEEVVPSDLFDWLDWQARSTRRATGKVVRLRERPDTRDTEVGP